jgi:predicted secreted protein
MKFTSALAIYVLFWAFSVFLVLPFGVRSHHETGEAMIPGQSDGAPANFAPKKVVVRTTVVATVLFGLFYLNYVEGWVLPDMIDLFNQPAAGPRP